MSLQGGNALWNISECVCQFSGEGRRRRPKTSFVEIFKVSTLEETQGRATKEKHDGATATDMEKDGLFLKNIHVVPEKVSNGSVERPKTNTSYKTKALIYFTFFAFFCLKKVLQSIVRRWNMQSTGCLGPDIPTKLVALISPIGGVESPGQQTNVQFASIKVICTSSQSVFGRDPFTVVPFLYQIAL